MTDDFEDNWEYDAFRVGRATRSVEVKAPGGGTDMIEEGTIQFDPINEEDGWLYQEDEWINYYIGPGSDGGPPLKDGVALSFDKLGILELPEPMTREDAHEWLDDHPDKWRQFLDESIESDTTAADLLPELR